MKFIICDSERMQNCIRYISELPYDKNYCVEIYEKKKKRSLNQNDLFHLWVDLMAKEIGTSPADMKEDIKRKILGMREKTNTLTGEITYYDYSTAALTKEQFTRLMTETQILATEYCNGMILPNRDDYEYNPTS